MTPDEKKTLLEATDRGRRAEEVQHTLAEKFDKLKKDAFDAWLMSDGPDTEGREHLYQRARAVEQLEQELIIDINEGDAAKQILSELDKEDENA
jgi:hypothetical protein